MKNFIKKNWALAGFILGFVLDQKTGILEQLTPNTVWQNAIRGIGAIVMAYYWTSKYNKKQVANAVKKDGNGAVVPSKGF